MSTEVVGTTNLAIRKDIQGLVDAGNGFFVVMAMDGTTMGIDPNGVIYWKVTNPGAYETCQRVDNLLYYKYGVVSYGTGFQA